MTHAEEGQEVRQNFVIALTQSCVREALEPDTQIHAPKLNRTVLPTPYGYEVIAITWQTLTCHTMN